MKKKFKKNVSNFNIKGSNLIEFIKYQDKKIYINPKQYFGNVDNEIWNYHIGGYRVLDKWLKTKRAKEEELLSEDINQFLDIVNIINETIKIMKDLKKIKLR